MTSVIVLASITGQPEAPVNAVSGTARARIQIRHTVDVPAETLVPNPHAHLDAHGLQMGEIVPVAERDMFLASRTDPDDPWVQRVVRSMAMTAGRQPNVNTDQFGVGSVGVLQGGAGDSGGVDSAFVWWMRAAWAGRARPRHVDS